MSPLRCLLSSLLAAILFSLAPSAPAFAVEPSLSTIAPYGLQRGNELEVTFSGRRLGEAENLLFYSPGISVAKIEKVNDNAIKATLAVADDCRIGIHAVRIQTRMGVSNLQTFCIGPYPELGEQEPNSEFSTPQPVELNTTISGVIQNEDVDYFVVEAKKGQRLTAELEGIRLGNNTLFDPYLAILDADRFELSRSDDAPLLRQDCLCAIVVPEDGKYIIQIRDSAYGGNGSSMYRLHVGTFPRPTAVMPAGGRPGETLQARWIGDPAGDWTESITLPNQADPEFGLFAKDDQGIAPSPNRIRVVDLENVLEVEPNETREAATAAVGPGALNGILQAPGDVDYFKFSAKKGQQFDIRLHGRNTLRSPIDSVMYIQNSGGGNVAGNDDSGGPDSYFRFNCPADGDYFILIHDHLKAGGPDYAYRVEITPMERAVTLTLPEKQRYVSTTMTVHRGNRTALMVNAARANWGGDLQLSFEGLPQGVTSESPLMTSNLSSVPVLFTAEPDASTGGALVAVRGRPTDEKLQDVVDRFSQRQMLVRGQNNRDMWGHDAERMAVALADESPFKIEVVQPTVPIVRDGSMGLKIVATRKEGFDAPIAVRMLYNPPGIGSSGSISIPKGQNEAIIPLTANGGAAIGKWPIVIRALAGHEGGTIETASQMAELEISDSFFNFAFQKAAGELGKQAALVVNVENKIEFDETCKVQLLGLPADTSTAAEPLVLSKATEELIFPITIGENAKPNTYKSLVCQAIIERNGETITHTLRGGELRVDKPLPPPKVAAKPAEPKAKPEPQVAQAPPTKPLSRLEMLRQKRAEETGGDAGGS